MNTSSNTTTLPAIDCAPWCEPHDGHTNAAAPEDQYCIAGYLELELAREPLEQIVDGGPLYRREVSVSLQRDPYSEPFVSWSGTKLSLAEARQIGEHLLRLADLGGADVA